MSQSALHPRLFTDDEWLQYTSHQTRAITFILLGGTMAIAGFTKALSGIHVPTTDLADVWLEPVSVLGWLFISAIGVHLFTPGLFAWRDAHWMAKDVLRGLCDWAGCPRPWTYTELVRNSQTGEEKEVAVCIMHRELLWELDEGRSGQVYLDG